MASFGMVCGCDRTHENNDTATLRITKNTSVFIVILHIHVVEEARLKTKIKMFYGARWRKPSEVVSGPPQNLDLEAIWGSETMPNPVQNAFTMKFNIAIISGVKKGVVWRTWPGGEGPSRTTSKTTSHEKDQARSSWHGGG